MTLESRHEQWVQTLLVVSVQGRRGPLHVAQAWIVEPPEDLSYGDSERLGCVGNPAIRFLHGPPDLSRPLGGVYNAQCAERRQTAGASRRCHLRHCITSVAADASATPLDDSAVADVSTFDAP
jgi:hypothetical protein